MNEELPTPVGNHSIGDPRNDLEGIYRELTVGHDPRGPDPRRRVMTSREREGRIELMQVAGLVSAVIAIYAAIISAGRPLIGKSRSRALEVLVVAFPELDLVKR